MTRTDRTGSGNMLDRLADTIGARAHEADPGSSYTAQLVAAGSERCAQKLIEEAAELALASVGDKREAVVAESADLLYHFLVLLAEREVALAEVLDELERRRGQSGLEEKAGREST